MKYDFSNLTFEPASNALGNINTRFYKQYHQQKEQAVRSIKSGEIMLICHMDDRLIVKTGDEEQEFTLDTTRYHNLKAMSHAALAVYYSLLQSTDHNTLTQAKYWVNQIRQQEPTELSAELADATSHILHSIQTTGTLTHAVISQYQHELKPIYAKLMLAAANDEVDSVVTKIESLRCEFNYPSSKTFMVVIGGNQPRYKTLASLIFKRWFKDLQQHVANYQHHVRYCETGCIDDAVALVATAIIDSKYRYSQDGAAFHSQC